MMHSLTGMYLIVLRWWDTMKNIKAMSPFSELMEQQPQWRTACNKERALQRSMKRQDDEEELVQLHEMEEVLQSSLAKQCQTKLEDFFLGTDVVVSSLERRFLTNYICNIS